MDLEVKVQGGHIRVYRTWQGSYGTWSLNPQHENLDLRHNTSLLSVIRRGVRWYQDDGTGIYRRLHRKDHPNAPKPDMNLVRSVYSAGASPASCESLTQDHSEFIVKLPNGGYRWINHITRSWAEYSSAGILAAWGRGSDVIGRVRTTSDGRRDAYLDRDGKEIIVFTRNAAFEVTSVKDYQGREVRYEHVDLGGGAKGISKVTDADGVVTTYRYNDQQISEKIIGDATSPLDNSDGVKLTMTYSGNRLITKTDDAGAVTKYSYNYDKTKGIFVRTTRTPENRVFRETFSEDGELGIVEQGGEILEQNARICEDRVHIDRSNRVTYFDKDCLGRLIRIIYPDGAVETREYEGGVWPEVGEVALTSNTPWGLKRVTDERGVRTELTRDSNGRAIEVKVLDGAVLHHEKRVFDERGNLLSKRVLIGDGESTADALDKWEYDQYGNPLSHTNPLGGVSHYRYNAQGLPRNITDPVGAAWTMSYSGRGFPETVLAPDGYLREYRYTKTGLLKRLLETYDVGKIADSRYRYDRGGNLTTVVDPLGNEWRYSYNRDGELTETTDPEGRGQRWEYLPDGRLAKLIDGIGNETRFEYQDREVSGISRPFSPRIITHHPGYDEEEVFDLRDRLLLRTIKGRGASVATTKYRYSRDSRTSSVEGPDGRVEETTVDGMGRPVTIKKTGWGTTAVQYLKSGREVAVTDSSGATSKRYLNASGLVTRLERPDGTGQNFRYDTRGKVVEYETSNKHLHKYLYTALGELEKHEAYSASDLSSPTRTISYRRNLRGDSLGYFDGEQEEVREVDALGRLAKSTTNFGSFTKFHGYTYERNGVKSTFTSPSGKTYSYQWDKGNRLMSLTIPDEGMINYSYDPLFPQAVSRMSYPGGSSVCTARIPLVPVAGSLATVVENGEDMPRGRGGGEVEPMERR